MYEINLKFIIRRVVSTIKLSVPLKDMINTILQVRLKLKYNLVISHTLLRCFTLIGFDFL